MKNVSAIDFFVISELEKGCDFYFIDKMRPRSQTTVKFETRWVRVGRRKERKHYRLQKKHLIGVTRFTQSSHIKKTCIYRPDKFWVIICLIKCAMGFFFFFDSAFLGCTFREV